jgi:hypothetical protein
MPEAYWSRLGEVVAAHGRALATFEELRRTALASESDVLAWTAALVERMLAEFPTGSREHARVHNLAAKAINEGLTWVEPPPAALLAHQVHSDDL